MNKILRQTQEIAIRLFEFLYSVFGVLIILPLTIVVFIFILYPYYIVATIFGLSYLGVTNYRVTTTEDGIALKNKLNKSRFVSWSDIECGFEEFSPPLNPPVIKLKTGEQIRLDISDKGILRSSFEQHELPYNRYIHGQNG